jgi:glucosamine--fructose-6-phosphate aminotransferase (isomerizing)
MIKEIYEQPNVIRNIAKNYEDQILSLSSIIQKARGTFFIGAGTAFNASLGGVYLFSKISKMHVNTALASEFNYLEDFLNKDSLVIAFSQSGETIDVIEPLQRARQKGSKIVAITNTLGSTIYRLADFKMLLGAGVEKAVASTKAYSAKLAILLMLSFASVKRINDAKKLLLKAAAEVERILNHETKNIKQIASILKKSKDIYTVGRGVSYATALEAALKIKEVSYIHTEGLAGGELKHGTIALISKGTPCIVFAPQDETYEAMVSNATEIKARGGIIVGVSTQRLEVFDYWIEVKDLEEASIIAQVVPAQLLAYYLSVQKNIDPDMPRNLAKSVTVK